MSMPTIRIPWNVPYQRNPFFTGREDVLNQLYRALHTEHTVALSQPQGLTGLGGIGKTQTVLEYAYRYQHEYDAVFWVRADSFATLTASLTEIARLLRLPECDEKDQDVIVQATLRWLHLHSNWLLIYDNIDDFSLAEPFLPKARRGDLLFTTRAHALGGLAQRLDIQQMEPETGALLLLRRASLLALQAILSMAHPDDQQLAQTIAREVDGLPLALNQAGAYIKETPCSLSDYLSLYQIRRGDLLQAQGHFEQDYPASVATTWSLSFEKVNQASPAAADLLTFCAFLAPDAIPEKIFTSGAAHLGTALAPVVSSPLEFNRIFREVLRFSLLQREADEHTFTIHRLVQLVLRVNLSTEKQRQWIQRAVPAVTAAIPASIEFADWPVCERLLPHALTCATWIEQLPLFTPGAADLLVRTAFYLDDRARYTEVEPLLKRALAIYEQYTEPSHPSVAIVCNNLAFLYNIQGRYLEAEPLLKRAIAICEQNSGKMQSQLATCFDNLAFLNRMQRKFTVAKPLYQQALAIRERAFGPEHPATIRSINNLAVFYNSQKNYKEAEIWLQRALALNEQILESTHPELAQCLSNLASIYDSQKKYKAAEPLFQRALAIYEKALGEMHPRTAECLNNFAILYFHEKRYQEAKPLWDRSIAIYEGLLGRDNPRTKMVYASRASLLMMMQIEIWLAPYKSILRFLPWRKRH